MGRKWMCPSVKEHTESTGKVWTQSEASLYSTCFMVLFVSEKCQNYRVEYSLVNSELTQ